MTSKCLPLVSMEEEVVGPYLIFHPDYVCPHTVFVILNRVE